MERASLLGRGSPAKGAQNHSESRGDHALLGGRSGGTGMARRTAAAFASSKAPRALQRRSVCFSSMPERSSLMSKGNRSNPAVCSMAKVSRAAPTMFCKSLTLSSGMSISRAMRNVGSTPSDIFAKITPTIQTLLEGPVGKPETASGGIRVKVSSEPKQNRVAFLRGAEFSNTTVAALSSAMSGRPAFMRTVNSSKRQWTMCSASRSTTPLSKSIKIGRLRSRGIQGALPSRTFAYSMKTFSNVPSPVSISRYSLPKKPMVPNEATMFPDQPSFSDIKTRLPEAAELSQMRFNPTYMSTSCNIAWRADKGTSPLAMKALKPSTPRDRNSAGIFNKRLMSNAAGLSSKMERCHNSISMGRADAVAVPQAASSSSRFPLSSPSGSSSGVRALCKPPHGARPIWPGGWPADRCARCNKGRTAGNSASDRPCRCSSRCCSCCWAELCFPCNCCCCCSRLLCCS
mmetsp:Transcript_26864/g.77740  ORF Transcript_26864/g.77740 Transcript_26864/m.77740 type:complete len:459 (+) Transcript_26864:60-1436(+)